MSTILRHHTRTPYSAYPGQNTSHPLTPFRFPVAFLPRITLGAFLSARRRDNGIHIDIGSRDLKEAENVLNVEDSTKLVSQVTEKVKDVL